MEKILIIGGVAAGATAAAKARRISPDAQITMLEAGPDISFANCGLPYFIGGDITSRSKLILQSPESFHDQYNVDVFTHTRATSIDRSNKIVTTVNSVTGDAKSFEYTKLILAQGGRPINPPIPGAGSDHVFSLWTLEDMDRINEYITEREPQTAVVVGGGFIGLEMVEALVKRGLKVQVVEMMPHVMALMEGEIAGYIEEEMESFGVGINTGRGVTEIGTNSVKLDDGSTLNGDLVLLSIGVRPTLKLAENAGLKLGEAGGLLVDDTLKTSDDSIYGAGDMVEIEHRVNGKKVRIPLAGPANRQGRIAAENALGGNHKYKGALGTSVVRVFEAVAGTTGLSLKQARALGIDADAVVVHKEHHTSYFPGSTPVSVMLVYDRNTGEVLGGETAGYKGADKRLDVIATAAAGKMSVADLADIDFAYSPPIGTANDAMNMAAFTAENRISGYSPSVTVAELDDLVSKKTPLFLDVRDVFSYEKAHVDGAVHIPLELLSERIDELSSEESIVVYDTTGKKGHQALRQLKGAGFNDVINISGGFSSLQRFQRAVGFQSFNLPLLEVETKTPDDNEIAVQQVNESVVAFDNTSPIVVDVRSREEFATGAYPDAVNIPLDEIVDRIEELGNKGREITLYCASGARSAYAQQQIMSMGFTNVQNGGGLNHMMANRPDDSTGGDANGPLVIDVRTPEEFSTGAFPGAVSIPLDELSSRVNDIGSQDRDITLYCASGARSAYAQQQLIQLGFTNVKNGGGLMHMMAQR